MLVYVRSRDIVPLNLHLHCRWTCLVRITSQTLYPLKVPHYPFNMKLEWLQGQAGYYREEKSIHSMPGFILHIIQPTAWSQFYLHNSGFIFHVIKIIINHQLHEASSLRIKESLSYSRTCKPSISYPYSAVIQN